MKTIAPVQTTVSKKSPSVQKVNTIDLSKKEERDEIDKEFYAGGHVDGFEFLRDLIAKKSKKHA